MQCTKLWYHDDRGFLPCGKCLPCKVNRRRQLTGRMLLEAAYHTHVTFCTLTYSDEALEYVLGDEDCPVPTVRKRHLVLHNKRMRGALAAEGRPYYRHCSVAEYGDRTHRPHCHQILFGLDHAEAQWFLNRTWEYGRADTYVASPELMQYTAGYTVKKLTKPDDDRLEKNQEPEWFTMSRGPAIGKIAVPGIASAHHPYYLEKYGDVEYTVRVKGKTWPLDQSMQRWIREVLHVPEKAADRKKVERPERNAQEQWLALQAEAKALRQMKKRRQTF